MVGGDCNGHGGDDAILNNNSGGKKGHDFGRETTRRSGE
jgi:hypothetical protein